LEVEIKRKREKDGMEGDREGRSKRKLEKVK
jgi:hypothetical protein